MTENEIKAWLNRAFYADKKVKAVEMLVQQCRERAQGLSVCYECNEVYSLTERHGERSYQACGYGAKTTASDI